MANLVAPSFMKMSAKRGLALHAEGESGDGLKPATVGDARKMVEGQALSEDKWRRIAPWIARHISDLDAVQGNEITAGLVAMLLWGGGSSKSSARRTQAYAERIVAQLDATEERAPAPKKDQIKGSKKNPAGSATGKKGGIELSKETEKALRNKLEEHNEKMKDRPVWTRTTLGALKAVYRRGSGAFSGSHRPGIGRAQWSMARVNAFLHLCRVGRPKNPKYITDYDLLNKAHPKYSGKRYDADQPREDDGKFGEGGGGTKPNDDSPEEYDTPDDETIMTQRDPVEVEALIEGEQQAYVDRLSQAKIEALDSYTAGGHEDMNKILRGGPPPPPKLDREEFERVEIETDRVLAAIQKAPGLKEEVTVYRGANLKSLGIKNEQSLESLVGKDVFDDGIVSTSFDANLASDFASGNEVLFEIKVPAGVRGLAVGQLSNFGSEREFLLGPGGFRVTGVKDSEGTTPTLVLERIPYSSEK